MRRRTAHGLLAVIAATWTPAIAEPTKRPLVEELTAIAQELADAIHPGNKAVYEKWLADDFILVDRDGSIQRKQEIVAGTTPAAAAVTLKLVVDQPELRELGDVAVLVHRVVEDETFYGQPLYVLYRETHVFRRTKAGWRLVVWQYVEIPRDPDPLPVDATRLTGLAGTYAIGDRRFNVTVRDGKVFGARAGQAEAELIPESDSVFAAAGSEFRKIFLRDASGRAVEIVDRRKGSDVRWRRIEPETPKN